MARIEIDNLDLTYLENTSSRTIFKKASLSLGPVGLIAITGESGSGKSSLFNLIAGYQKADSGGIDIDVDSDRINVIFQNYFLIDHLNVERNVALPLILSGMKEIDALEIARRELNNMGLIQLAKRNVDEISGGQKARVSLVRGIIDKPKIILADEPTGSLDRENSEKVMALLKEISKTRLVVIVTHDLDSAYRYADEIYRIYEYRFKKVLSNNSNSDLKETEEGYFLRKKMRFKENVKLAFSFLRRRVLKVAITSIFCSICFSLFLTVVNFNQNTKIMLDQVSTEQIDFNCVSLVEKRKIEIENQNMSLVKKVRLSDAKKNELKHLDENIEFFPCLDSLLSPHTNMKYEDEFLESKVFFSPSFPETSKVIGNIPTSYNQIIVNQDFLDIQEGLKVGSILTYENDLIVETNYLSSKVKDVLHIKMDLTIVGVSKKQNLFKRPNVYYDYNLMKTTLEKIPLENASNYYSYNIDLKARMTYLSNEDDPFTKFKTIAKVDNPLSLEEAINSSITDIEMSNTGLDLSKSLNDLFDSFSQLISIFIALIFICSFFLEIVFVNNLLEEKKKELALYLSMHLTKNQFFSSSTGQIAIVNSVIIFFSIVLFLLISLIGNALLSSLNFPLFFKVNLPLGAILIFILSASLFSYLSSRIPLNKIYSKDLIDSLRGN